MRRNKNCVFKNRIEDVFQWKSGAGTHASNYIEDREKGIVDFNVEGHPVAYIQIKKVARILRTQNIILNPCGSYDDGEDSYVNFEAHDVRFE